MLLYLICLMDEEQVSHLGIYSFLGLEIYLSGVHLFQFYFSDNTEAGASYFGVWGQSFPASLSTSFATLFWWSRLNRTPLVMSLQRTSVLCGQ